MALNYSRPILRMSADEQNRALHEIAVEVAEYVSGKPADSRAIPAVTRELAHQSGLSPKEVFYGIQYGLSHQILDSATSLGPLSALRG